MPGVTLRMTTDASLTAILEERPFFLGDTLTLLLGPDETVHSAVGEVGRHFIDETVKHWRDWVRRLAIPFEWQRAVIRAAIALQQNAYDDTGAIVAAMTTSVPEAASSGRNWDYRYCWLRDGAHTVAALNSLGATDTMERYLAYIVGVIAGESGRSLQPVYRINGDSALGEEMVRTLPGYRGMGPVRNGNDASRVVQHDVYGSAILVATHVFFDERLVNRGDVALFERLIGIGRRARDVYHKPDSGPWELRRSARLNTMSAVMCWAACDRLARIAGRLGLADRAQTWQDDARTIRRYVEEQCWSDARASFVSSAGGGSVDAGLLQLADLGFVAPDDPRFAGTVRAVEGDLKRGDFVFRYVEADDFGEPVNAFVASSFWYANALADIGRRDEARAMFERLLACRNRHGLLSEHVDGATGEHWGNFVQTTSIVGLINSAMRLSAPWNRAFCRSTALRASHRARSPARARRTPPRGHRK
jgi:GH15 family glucan-1,4-alpha-glucosidase